jgi:hypothetical protein
MLMFLDSPSLHSHEARFSDFTLKFAPTNTRSGHQHSTRASTLDQGINRAFKPRYITKSWCTNGVSTFIIWPNHVSFATVNTHYLTGRHLLGITSLKRRKPLHSSGTLCIRPEVSRHLVTFTRAQTPQRYTQILISQRNIRNDQDIIIAFKSRYIKNSRYSLYFQNLTKQNLWIYNTSLGAIYWISRAWKDTAIQKRFVFVHFLPNLNQTAPITTTTIMILCWYVLPVICELPNQLNTNFHSAIPTEYKIRLWKDLGGHYYTDETQDSHDNAVDNGNDMFTAVLSLPTLSMSLEETRQHVCRIHRPTTVHICLPSAIDDRSWIWIFFFGPLILFAPKDINYLAFQYFDFEHTWRW